MKKNWRSSDVALACKGFPRDLPPAGGDHLMPYVARTKDAKQKLEPVVRVSLRAVTLACGCTTEERPGVSNPDRWFCCDAWQRRAR